MRSSTVAWILLAQVALLPGCASFEKDGGASTGSGSDSPSQNRLLEVWRGSHRLPADYVLDKFIDHDWVFLGEYHRIKHDVDLIAALVPRLHATTDVRHLAFEFLCRDRTQEANQLLTAPEWDRARSIEFFRSQFVSWPYEEYLDIFRQVWESNRRLAAERGAFELVGLHPCPDYEVMHYGSDPEAVAREEALQRGYDEIMAETLESQLLARDLPALVYTGIAHSTAKFPEYVVGTDRQLVRMGNLVRREPYADRMFFIALHVPFYDSASDEDIYPFDGILDRLMLRFGADIGFDVVGTPFEELRHTRRDPHSITAHRFGELYDGYIMFATPIREYVGVTCIEDWIATESDYRTFWRRLSSKQASERFSRIPFEEFLADRCAPRPDHGVEFSRRFRGLERLD